MLDPACSFLILNNALRGLSFPAVTSSCLPKGCLASLPSEETPSPLLSTLLLLTQLPFLPCPPPYLSSSPLYIFIFLASGPRLVLKTSISLFLFLFLSLCPGPVNKLKTFSTNFSDNLAKKGNISHYCLVGTGLDRSY